MKKVEIVAKERKKSLNLSFSPSVITYLQSESEAFGMSISAYLTMIVQQNRIQTQALNEMSNMKVYIEKLESMAVVTDKDK